MILQFFCIPFLDISRLTTVDLKLFKGQSDLAFGIPMNESTNMRKINLQVNLTFCPPGPYKFLIISPYNEV